MLVIAVLGILFSALLGSVIYNSIANPVEKIANTVKKVSAGDFGARTGLAGGDELAELGQGFDQLLDERLTNLVKAEQENDSLNVSVISLLQAVSQLSQRDLTVKVPVNEDITGPMADALNLLTTETAKVLAEVTHVSEEVATASNMVKAQSDTVIAVANDERQEVERATSELMAAAEDMSRIAELAKSCNQTAEGAIESTRKALDTVVNTVDGITSTRDTIRETEKRIKRLGERSQEITGVVGLINTIAERTHILALNASMHAASAGEAGRGFAVVADEVQRLAENAREATAQISTLVSSIQVETADTVNAMNLAISQVVEGSRMAEQAGEQMKRTQQTTADLVASVQQIAVRSQDQARASSALLERAKQIQNSTVLTGQRLMEQNEYTGNLVEYAKSLVNSVRVFKLPATENA
jgi:methyl-accepting chemotaxis protein